jgi:aspartyl protease family protein
LNNGDQAADFLYLLLVLVLVASAFSARRMPVGRALKMFAAWVSIFAAAYIVFTLRDDFLALGRRIADGESQVVQEGRELRIRQADDGHFWVDGKLNGKAVRFLVDSGATTTSISADTARRAGIERNSSFKTVVQTANGLVAVDRGRADRLDIGTIERRDLAVHISEAFGDTNVLGMNFLSSLSSWGVQGKWLVLKP